MATQQFAQGLGQSLASAIDARNIPQFEKFSGKDDDWADYKFVLIAYVGIVLPDACEMKKI